MSDAYVDFGDGVKHVIAGDYLEEVKALVVREAYITKRMEEERKEGEG